MNMIKAWISAFRLRTLPLATSAVLMGMVLADIQFRANLGITLLCLLTAICLQVLSNLANDYGDFMKGTDNEQRLGNVRAMQSGVITKTAMIRMVVLFVVLSLSSGIFLLYKAGSGNMSLHMVFFFILGVIAIAAAIKYTMGKYAYGYKGWGDLFVFLFFGPVAVIGTFLLNTGYEFYWEHDAKIIFPAIGVGLLSVGVLNVNNIRDIENDKAFGKQTIPVKIGLQRARYYHAFLLITALLCINLFAFLYSPWAIVPLLWPNYRIWQNLRAIYKEEPSPHFNRYLKKLSLSTLLLVFIFWITSIVLKAFYMAQAFRMLDN